jgi:exosortase/archaeosortase family protein
MGWEVLRDGRFLRLPHVVLEVASECSGVGQLTALIAFAVPLGLMMHSMLWPRLVLLGLTLPFALVVNVIRIMLIALWNYNGLQSATHGPFELLRMPFIHPLALLFLYLSSLFLLKFEKKKPSLSSSFVNADVPRLALKPRATSIGISIVILTIVSTFFFRANPTHFPHGAEDLPYRAGEWTGETASDSTFSFYLGKPDLLIQRKYDNPMYGPVYVTMARFDHQSARNRISSIVWRRSFDDQHPTDVTVSPSVTIRATIAGTVYNNKNSSTLSWFDIDGASCPTIAEARKKIISTTLKKKRNAATFIAITGYGVSGKAADDAAAAFATAFFQHIQQLLKAAP